MSVSAEHSQHTQISDIHGGGGREQGIPDANWTFLCWVL